MGYRRDLRKSRLTLGEMFKKHVLKHIKIDLNRVQVAPFGPKLGQNDAPDLRIILDRFLDQKSQFKNKKSRFFLRGGGMGRSHLNFGPELLDQVLGPISKKFQSMPKQP